MQRLPRGARPIRAAVTAKGNTRRVPENAAGHQTARTASHAPEHPHPPASSRGDGQRAVAPERAASIRLREDC